jgi:hypothetical protein
MVIFCLNWQALAVILEFYGEDFKTVLPAGRYFCAFGGSLHLLNNKTVDYPARKKKILPYVQGSLL